MINDNMLEEEIRNVERRFLRANPKDIENEPSDSNSYAIRVCGNRLRVDRDQFRCSETYYLYINSLNNIDKYEFYNCWQS